uniref:NADH-ubiquinone oxidoreductase chain 1 n=1 Tax=Pseudorimula sp. RSIO35641 TaxID=2652779 RepID=A0A5J6VA63_9VEST|nr:NADH dehydrogenase subunit 1 [Pseudorimula sp. RSIO35641]
MTISALISFITTYICILLGVAFFTLLERKGLGYFQTRKGPNKVGLAGLPQPLADAAKLFTKEMTKPTLANQSPYLMAPILSLILALLLWQVYPVLSSSTSFSLSIMFFLCVSSMNVYGTLLAGWASNSKYALLGAIRAIAQTISYEVSLALILMFTLFLSGYFSTLKTAASFHWVWPAMILLPVGLIWLASCVAETNRAPFDFAEGESELVSGFNVEYSAGGFALIFMAEYANILVMSMLSAALFLGGSNLILELDMIMALKTFAVAFLFIWLRATFPRFRYDLLMGLTWKAFLPCAISALILILSLSLM